MCHGAGSAGRVAHGGASHVPWGHAARKRGWEGVGREWRDGNPGTGKPTEEIRDGNGEMGTPGCGVGGQRQRRAGGGERRGIPIRARSPHPLHGPAPRGVTAPRSPPPRTQRQLARGRARAERAAACPPRGRCGAADHGGSGTADPFPPPPNSEGGGCPANPTAAPPPRRLHRGSPTRSAGDAARTHPEGFPGTRGSPEASGPRGRPPRRPHAAAPRAPPARGRPRPRPSRVAPPPRPHWPPPPRRSARAERGVLASACDVTGRGGRR